MAPLDSVNKMTNFDLEGRYDDRCQHCDLGCNQERLTRAAITRLSQHSSRQRLSGHRAGQVTRHCQESQNVLKSVFGQQFQQPERRNCRRR